MRTRWFRLGLGALCLWGVAAASAGEAPGGKSAFDAVDAADAAAIREAKNFSRGFVAASKRVRPAVVNIRALGRSASGGSPDPFERMFEDFFHFRGRPRAPSRSVSQGSGVIVSAEGHILTNHHVVGGSEHVEVQLLDGRTLPAELVGSDPDSDIAVLRIEADNLVFAPLADSDNCEVGEWVLAVGNPFGLDSSVSAGIISARGRSNVGVVEIEDFIQTDAAINPGNSGGPLVNLDGAVVGINTVIVSRSGGYQGIGFAVPSNIARSVMASLIANRKVSQTYLGIETQEIDAKLAAAFGLEAPRGALVKSVAADGPGARAGLRRSDVIIGFGRRDIPDDHTLRNLVATTPAGQEVEIRFIRDGKEMSAKATVEAVPEVVVIERQAGKALDMLGIAVADAGRDQLGNLGYPPDAAGVLVTGVQPNSAMRRMSPIPLMPGCLILRIDGKEVNTVEELRQALGQANFRNGVTMQWRDGRRVFPPVELRFNLR